MTIAKLIEAVEAGNATAYDFGLMFPLATNFEHTRAWEAYNGSLDAAKALHDALLPKFMPSVGQNIWHCYWFATVTTTDGDRIGDSYSGQSTDNPARAWLLAILRALQEGEHGL